MEKTSKYQRWYDNLVERAKQRNLTVYTEQHHIIPKCMGGSNNKSNLVHLTFREHFLAHSLLCKIYKNTQYSRQLNYAFMCMHKQQNKFQQRVASSRQYNKLKEEFYSSLRGVKRTQAVIDKIRNSRVYRPHTEETKKRISEALKGINRKGNTKLAAINLCRAEDQKLSSSVCKRIRELREQGAGWKELGLMFGRVPNVVRNVVLRTNGYENR